MHSVVKSERTQSKKNVGGLFTVPPKIVASALSSFLNTGDRENYCWPLN